ncbi:Bone morphogenetic protein receptor type-1B [Nymphon striatum]|nr:Bone morphogenetic protein receptor type-1B [Nymphon striatum]
MKIGRLFPVISSAAVSSGYFPRSNGLKCYCDGHCPEYHLNNTCDAGSNKRCFSAVELRYDIKSGETYVDRTFGCLPPDESGLMNCKGSLSSHRIPKNIACCDDQDFCNKYLKPTLPPMMTTAKPSSVIPYDDGNVQDHEMALIVSLSLCALALAIICAFFFCRRRQQEIRRRRYIANDDRCDSFINPHQTLKHLIDQSETSGSGSGLPLLVQRTIAKQIQMISNIGKGKYGEVWKAKWRGETIAVKVFFTADEKSWFRETEIYQTVLMRHENILGFIAADMKGSGSFTQLLLITDYHELGSLYDFLQERTVTIMEMVKLALSASMGIAHLHTEIFGTRGKPSIAHCDIKSKNILVKKNGQCAIADFGLAVRFLSDLKKIDEPSNDTRTGTKCYMAPEVLSNTLMKENFESYKMADMYSFSLVLWEIGRRTLTDGKADLYEVPYYDCIPADPTMEEMRDAVCLKNIRPVIPERWEKNECLKVLSKIMQECWHQNQAARLTSLRVKKTLCKLDFQNLKTVY